MSRPVVALVGAGQMGSNHARVIAESTAADLGMVIDGDADASEQLAHRYGARASTHLEDGLSADAVIVASSTASHLACARPFIEAGVPTFVEKPLAPTLDEVRTLIALAERHDVVLKCGFVERFNAAFRTGAEHLTEPPAHVVTVRHSPPAPRIATSVVADLLLHDLDVAVQLFAGQDPTVLGSACHRPRHSEHNEIADCSIAFETGLATLSANRMSQRKVRSVTVHTPVESIEIDLLRQDVTVFRHVSQQMVAEEGHAGYRASTEMDIPFVRHRSEPLAHQFEHFLDLVDGRADHDEERAAILLPHVLMEQVESTGQASAGSPR